MVFPRIASTPMAGFTITVLDGWPGRYCTFARPAVDDDLWKELLVSGQSYLVIGAAGIAVAIAVLFAAPDFLRRPLPLPRLRRGRWTGREVGLALLTHAFFVPT